MLNLNTDDFNTIKKLIDNGAVIKGEKNELIYAFREYKGYRFVIAKSIEKQKIVRCEDFENFTSQVLEVLKDLEKTGWDIE